MAGRGHSTEAWPAELVERIKALWADGRSAGYIAKETGKTRNAVISKLHRLDMMRGRPRVYDPGGRVKKVKSPPTPGRVIAMTPKAPPPVYVEPEPSIPPEQRSHPTVLRSA